MPYSIAELFFPFIKQKRKNNSILWSVSLVAQLNIYLVIQNLLSVLCMICSVLCEALEEGPPHSPGSVSVTGGCALHKAAAAGERAGVRGRPQSGNG